MKALPPVADAPARRGFVRRAVVGGAAALGLRGTVVAQTRVIRLRWANNIPLNHPSNRCLQEAAEALRRDSDGRIAVDIFPDSQLGGETDLLAQLRSGAIDLLPLSGLTLQTLVPVAGINGLAFAFDDHRAVWATMDGELGALVRAAIESAGLHPFERMLDNGFRHVTTANRPIRSAADFEGLRIRVPVSPLRTSMFKALGAAPTSINLAELYVSLQTRLVEAQENPLVVIDLVRLYEVQRFCSLTRHMWDGHWLLFNGARWQGLPSEVRTLVTDRLTAAVLRQRDAIRLLNDGLEPRLRAAGLVFNTPRPESFRDALANAGFYDEWQRRFGATAIAALRRGGGLAG